MTNVFHDALNKTNQTGLTPEEAAANAAQEYWKIDAGEYGLMGSYTFDIESPTDLSTLSQIAPLYKTCGPWQMMNGNCNGPTTNAPENQTSFDWNAYLPMGNIQAFGTYYLQIPVRPICNPGDDCLGGLTFEMCRIDGARMLRSALFALATPVMKTQVVCTMVKRLIANATKATKAMGLPVLTRSCLSSKPAASVAAGIWFRFIWTRTIPILNKSTGLDGVSTTDDLDSYHHRQKLLGPGATSTVGF